MSELIDAGIPAGKGEWLQEERFINHRLTWLGVSNTILFGSYALPISSVHGSQLHKIIPVIGLIISAFILIGVLGAILAMYTIKKKYQLENYLVSKSTTFMGWTCSAGIPAVFVSTWIWLMFKT